MQYNLFQKRRISQINQKRFVCSRARKNNLTEFFGLNIFKINEKCNKSKLQGHHVLNSHCKHNKALKSFDKLHLAAHASLDHNGVAWFFVTQISDESTNNNHEAQHEESA